MDASQEIVALGVCQFVGSFIGSMPVTASFGRSAIQCASGVRTTFAGCVTALIILCACAFLTPHFAYIPTSALSAVIICAMIFTIEVEILLPIWRSKSKCTLLDEKLNYHNLHTHIYLLPFMEHSFINVVVIKCLIFLYRNGHRTICIDSFNWSICQSRNGNDRWDFVASLHFVVQFWKP